ncbi:hypothetical protein L2E82_37920 [Cichorium intybus]|uniref:Uncharacterized protein n=1 Tax=Cichorium intybus TaxID=13427 RepID=A0ACB9AEQ1_CICIN|nr:hypothetical protein L2E82_37920 [Cichorium intybus]
MVFGKASSRPEDTETEPPDNIVDLEENEEERPSNSAGGSQRNAEKDATIPLLEETRRRPKYEDVRLCLTNKEKLQRLSSKVKEAESGGVSKALKIRYLQEIQHQRNDLRKLLVSWSVL